ncbi:helix-turn-helix transcriptional regulator [Clostridium sp.]|uniref:helix-turn-helix domain-containing protein n=1 Tax=Clostridium sp. TaxID=1506 RepID=UPI003216BA37
MNIGDIIKTERKKKNLTQKELAEKINKSERMIQKYENGEVTPSIEVLNNIGAALGVFIFSFANNENTVIKENPKNYSLEQYMYALGYEILTDMSEGYVTLIAPEGQYEIAMNDLNELTSSTESFIRFKISEIIKHSRKLGK